MKKIVMLGIALLVPLAVTASEQKVNCPIDGTPADEVYVVSKQCYINITKINNDCETLDHFFKKIFESIGGNKIGAPSGLKDIFDLAHTNIKSIKTKNEASCYLNDVLTSGFFKKKEDFQFTTKREKTISYWNEQEQKFRWDIIIGSMDDLRYKEYLKDTRLEKGKKETSKPVFISICNVDPRIKPTVFSAPEELVTLKSESSSKQSVKSKDVPKLESPTSSDED